MTNILFSSTRQWNPGDEFILMGILNVMRSIADFNPVIFNRNPEIRRCSGVCFSVTLDKGIPRVKRLKPGRYDNSFKEEFREEAFIDLAVFAGTPEWASPRLRSMYEYIDRHAIPAIYLGIGAADPEFTIDRLDRVYRRVLTAAKLITVRDRLCRSMLRPLLPVFLPCPSLFASPPEFEREIGKVANIGLIFSVNTGVKHNKIDDRTYRFQMELYRNILKRYSRWMDIEFICHYVDELPAARREFGSWKCNYSYDAGDYPAFYNKFDLVVGARVHGIGLAASMGIPGIHLYTDPRSRTCESFYAASLTAGCGLTRALAILERKIEDAPRVNKEILQRKNEVFRAYYNHLLPVLRDINCVRESARIERKQETGNSV